MDFVTALVLLLISSATLIIYLQQWRKESAKLPPGPFPLPIIGNILQLGDLPHRSLAKLSKFYGPLMHLKLGSKQAIVVSSPEMAKEVLLKHDLICSSRAVPIAAQVQSHHEASVVFLPAEGNKWRNFRKICKEHIFTMHKLEESEALRQEKLSQLRSYLGQCCAAGRVVDISEVVFITALNLTSTTLFSLDFAHFESDSGHEMMKIITGLSSIAGTPNLADYFPLLKLIDPQGIYRKAKFYAEKLLEVLDKIIDERLQYRGTSSATKKSDFLEVLLDLNQENDATLSHHDLKHLLFDLIIGGADTTTNTVVWAMTELLRNPSKMSKVKEELNSVIGEKEQVQERDIPRLPYLHALLRETFRYHPTAPFLVPHTANADVEINGYSVPKDSTILVNLFSIGRDEAIWSKPNLFEPERFLDTKLDYKGKDFELLPFGSGRRMCPGMPLAHIMLHAMLASMIHNLHWKLEPGVKPEDIDVNEIFGLTLHKVGHLKAFPVKH